MSEIKTNRIQSLDLLKGIIMIIMALDHARDYFHNGAFLFDPTDPRFTNIALYLTRWSSHFCAPTFSFLAGISAYLIGRKKTKAELSAFLLKRGVWLVFVEVVIVSFAWYFDFSFGVISLLVIWALGISMIVLAGVVHLPLKYILAFSLIVIFGHNLLDYMEQGDGILWAMLHRCNSFMLTDNLKLVIGYPVVPWFAVMSLGYYFGTVYESTFDAAKRRKLFNIIGAIAIAAFIIIKLLDKYGTTYRWWYYESILKTLYIFMSPNKYPPSLAFLLMTLGGVFLFLANTEKLKGGVVNFFSVYGKVPFFFYILHIVLIHLVAMVVAEATGFGWETMLLKDWVTLNPALKGYGVDLWLVYVLWAAVMLSLYPLCRKFGLYKLQHKEKTWLSYL